MDIFSRTELLIGNEALERLASSRVAVFGIGGVGSFAAEALVRAGIGAIDLIDNDSVDITNINRQLIATTKTLGRPKVDVAKERYLEINPSVTINTFQTFFLPETASGFDFTKYDYVLDAIDTVTGKLALIEKAYEQGTPVISSMGAGNKLDPTAFMVADIYETSVCPLAKIMRKELRARGIKNLKVVYSKEPPYTPFFDELSLSTENNSPDECNNPHDTQKKYIKHPPGSISFVPSVAGLIMAGEVVRDLTSIRS